MSRSLSLARVLPVAFTLAAGLALPGVALAGGIAVVAPLVPTGVDQKVSTNLTSLLSSELDFSAMFDTVNELNAAPASLNASCLSNTSCLGGIAKANSADAVLTGSVASGGNGLKIALVLYDAKKNAIIRKKSFDIASDVATVASQAPKMVKEITGQGAPAAEQEEKATKVAAAAFAEDEDEGFAFEDAPANDVKGKTRISVDKKGGTLTDEETDEDREEAAAAAAAKAKAEADARKKAEADARAKAEADARKKAEAEARAKADADAKARAAAEAKRRAEEEARRQEEEEERAAQAEREREEEEEREREEQAAAARAAKSKSDAAAKSKSKATTEEEDLEAELAAFSFGGATSSGIVMESDDDGGDDSDDGDSSSSGGTFSSRYSSSSSSAKSTPTKTTSSKSTSSKSSKSSARVVEEEEEDPEEYEDEPEEDFEDEEEEAPRKSTSSSSSKRSSSSRDDDDDDSDSDRSESFSSRYSSRSSDDDDGDSRYSSRRSSDDDDSRSSRSRRDEEDDDDSRSSRSRYDDDDDSGGRSRASIDTGAAARFALAARAGYSRYGNLNFVNYGVEAEIPVASRVLILLGVEGASTNRNYTDKEREVIADAAGIDPTQVQDWNAVLPLDIGFVYKVPTSKVQPYVGADFVAVMYTSAPDFAFGGRLRSGVDLLVADNFGFNIDLGLGVLSGDQFEAIQRDLTNFGFYPEVSAGTVLVF